MSGHSMTPLRKACLFLLVAVAVAEDAACTASSPGCPSMMQADANTLLQTRVGIDGELAPGQTDEDEEEEKNTYTDEAAASAHGTETLGANKTRHLSSLLSMTNATTMLAGIQEIARSGESPAFDQVQLVKTLLTNLSAILWATREAAATATTDARAAVQSCNTKWDTHFTNIQAEFTTDVKGSQRSAHKECRIDEKDKYVFNLTNSDSPCVKLGTSLHDIKQKGFALANFMKVVGQRSDLVNEVNNFVEELTAEAATMTTLDANCTAKEGELADTKRQCNEKQAEFQEGFCSIKTRLEQKRDTLDECYEREVAAYNKHVTDTQKLVIKWNIEEATLQKILCFCDVWLADADSADKDTDGNNRSQVNQTDKFGACNTLNTSHVPVDYGQVDPKAIVDLTSVSNHPGHPGFITEDNGFFTNFYEPVVACTEATTTAKPTTQAPTTAEVKLG